MGEPVRRGKPHSLLWVALLSLAACLFAILVAARSLPVAVPERAETAAKVTQQQVMIAHDISPAAVPDAAVKNKNNLTLQRVAPRAPLSAIAAPMPPAPPKPVKDLPKRWQPVGTSFASAAGIIQAGTLSISLEGLDTLTAEDRCTAPSGEDWPCGMVARTAFRAYLRSRTLNCDIPDGLIDTAISASCLLAGEDPAKWLVQNGWAKAIAGSDYEADGVNAKQLGKGIYGAPPR